MLARDDELQWIVKSIIFLNTPCSLFLSSRKCRILKFCNAYFIYVNICIYQKTNTMYIHICIFVYMECFGMKRGGGALELSINLYLVSN